MGIKNLSKKEFGGDYPVGPCPDDWKNCKCGCGWVYNEDEVIFDECEDDCDTCNYCGHEKCPKCKRHLHCGGCV